MVSLNSAPVSAMAVEGSVMALWQEYLTRYFRGEYFRMNGADVLFPKATLVFQQAPLPQPINGVAISCTWMQAGRSERRMESVGGQVATVETRFPTWLFWIRARVVDSGTGGNSRQLAQDTADRLYGLLANERATRVLAQKRISRLRPETPVLVVDSDWSVRMVAVHGRIFYPVNIESEPAGEPAVAPQQDNESSQ